MESRCAFANGATPDFKGDAGTVRSAAVRFVKAAYLIWKRTYIDWLAEETRESRFQQPIVIADVRHGAESDDWNVRRSCSIPERACGIGAGHVRETEVQQDQVGQMLRCEGQCLGRTSCLECLETGRAQHVPGEFQVLFVVVDDQYEWSSSRHRRILATCRSE